MVDGYVCVERARLLVVDGCVCGESMTSSGRRVCVWREHDF